MKINNRFGITILISVLLVAIFGLGRATVLGEKSSREAQAETYKEINRKLKVRGLPEEVIQISNITGLDSDEFPVKFSLGIKNVSQKNIRAIGISLVLVGSDKVLGINGPLSILLRYGDEDLIFGRMANSNATLPMLLPGETIVIRPDDQIAKSTLKKIQEYNFSFGDRIFISSFMVFYDDGSLHRVKNRIIKEISSISAEGDFKIGKVVHLYDGPGQGCAEFTQSNTECVWGCTMLWYGNAYMHPGAPDRTCDRSTLCNGNGYCNWLEKISCSDECVETPM